MSKRKHSTDEGSEPQHRILDRLNQIAMSVYGPAARSESKLEGAHESEAAHRWYDEVQEHFYVEKDEHGNEYLYHRDDSGEGTNTGTSHN